MPRFSLGLGFATILVPAGLVSVVLLAQAPTELSASTRFNSGAANDKWTRTNAMEEIGTWSLGPNKTTPRRNGFSAE